MKQPAYKTLMLMPAMLLLVAIVALLIPKNVIAAYSGKIAPTGSIIIYVQDGNTKKPLKDACVTIPETGRSFYTDENGKTEMIRLPIIEDTQYRDILAKPWGEITILVYKNGYVDCAIFHVNIWENQTRNGPTVLLFPTSGDGSNQPFTLTEGPNRIWVNELLNKYKPAEIH